MLPRALSVFSLCFLFTSVLAQKEFTVVEDLRAEWMTFKAGAYQPLGTAPATGLNSVYFSLSPQRYSGNYLRLKSDRRYYFFVNGKIRGEFQGETLLSIDSLLQSWYGIPNSIALYQDGINERDLHTEIISKAPPSRQTNHASLARPYSPFRDFVVIAGLILSFTFVLALRLNPKLASDYFSFPRLFSSRELDDGQASARLTGSSNAQFYILCSLMIGYYLSIVLYNLPPEYALPIRFQASTFWSIGWEWLKLSAVIFFMLILKILIIFCLTRLFGMRGLARFHFFNWIRLLLVIFSVATAVLFMYFIARGSNPDYFVAFLWLVVVALMLWIAVAFFKLSGRSGHSMFHLFSYLCATEIIPLLITVKVLFQ